MKRTLLVLVATLLALLSASLLPVRPAFACSCGHIPNGAEAWADADVVFVGKVTRAGVRYPTSGTTRKDMLSELEVRSVSKGQVGSSVTIGGFVICAYPFRQGGTYLVYADYTSGYSGELDASVCSGTELISGPEPDPALAALGVAVGTLLISLVAFVRLYNRRRRKEADGLDA